ncbi:ATP-binding protein [Actinoplanes derwentensis]|uniref:Histidine kinase/HSP90-like ATPase domain-containing protein n=1 Tax=Actinoplanes derwentensis TaxID=113562 RepID=A0A1H2AVA3_9ACTN|nr:ATP-binding protein [Actinoplanes derwentensis]GID84280.1 hypothetical protein Ade03nite_32040 [Actinoplanes derwentensis]SDT49950.1 hypothetical protein SAMN04489716_4128 [Actinoplanes derwentensis]
MPGSSVTAVADDETWVVEFTVHGTWERTLWQTAYHLLNQCLAQHPAGLLLDLRGLDDPGVISAQLWLTAATTGDRMEPPVRVAACLPPGTGLADRLDGVAARRVLPIFRTLPAARTHLAGQRHFPDQVRLRLPPESTAAAGARHVVTVACEQWGLDPLVARARLVISELVLNAAEHAGTPIDVLISRRSRGDRLHLAVLDGSAGLPEMRPEATTVFGERGYGLRIVDAAVQTWGALPTRTGKMVWALIF